MKVFAEFYKNPDATLTVKPNGEQPCGGVVNLQTSHEYPSKEVRIIEIEGKLYLIPLNVLSQFSDGETVLKKPDDLFLLQYWRSNTLKRLDKVLDITPNDSAFMRSLKTFINTKAIDFDGDGINYVRSIVSEIEKGTITMKKAEDFISRFGCEFEVAIIQRKRIV